MIYRRMHIDTLLLLMTVAYIISSSILEITNYIQYEKEIHSDNGEKEAIDQIVYMVNLIRGNTLYYFFFAKDCIDLIGARRICGSDAKANPLLVE